MTRTPLPPVIGTPVEARNPRKAPDARMRTVMNDKKTNAMNRRSMCWRALERSESVARTMRKISQSHAQTGEDGEDHEDDANDVGVDVESLGDTAGDAPDHAPFGAAAQVRFFHHRLGRRRTSFNLLVFFVHASNVRGALNKDYGDEPSRGSLTGTNIQGLPLDTKGICRARICFVRRAAPSSEGEKPMSITTSSHAVVGTPLRPLRRGRDNNIL